MFAIPQKFRKFFAKPRWACGECPRTLRQAERMLARKQSTVSCYGQNPVRNAETTPDVIEVFSG